MDRNKNRLSVDVETRSAELLQQTLVDSETLRAAVSQVRQAADGQGVAQLVAALKLTESSLDTVIDLMRDRCADLTGLPQEHFHKIKAYVEVPGYALAGPKAEAELTSLAEHLLNLIVSARIAREEVDLSGDQVTATTLTIAISAFGRALTVIEGFLPPTLSDH